MRRQPSRGDHNAIDLVLQQLGHQRVGIPSGRDHEQQQLLAGLAQLQGERLKHRGVERIAHVAHHQGNDAGAPPVQRAGDGIGSIAQLIGHGQDACAHCGGDPRLGVEGTGDRRSGDPQALGQVPGGDPGDGQLAGLGG
ncbi:hypothetical protein D3C80_1166990 [compost metagenome]